MEKIDKRATKELLKKEQKFKQTENKFSKALKELDCTKKKLFKKDQEFEKQYNVNKTNKSIYDNIVITHKAQMKDK